MRRREFISLLRRCGGVAARGKCATTSDAVSRRDKRFVTRNDA